MLYKPAGAAGTGQARVERAARAAPSHRAMLERRRGNQLLTAWKAARADLAFPSLAALQETADPELFRHSMLLRVGARGALTIERFGPPMPATPASNGSASLPVVTPLVVTWVLSVGSSALRRRAPVTESDDVKIGARMLRYRCAVVPVSSDGAEVDALVGVLGYRWS
jgi:hypothetical protein